MNEPRIRRWLIGAGVTAGTWGVTAAVIVPWLIRSAYAGRSLSWINAVLSGRNQHPVEHYIQVWYGLAWKLTLVMAGFGTLLFFRRRILGGFDRTVRAEPSVGAGTVFGLALIWGLIAGLAEGGHILVRKWISPLNAATFDQSVDAIWMAPIGETGVFVAIALAAVIVLRPWRKPISYRFAMGAYTFLTVYGLLRSARLGMGIWPIALLSIGVAVQWSQWATKRHLVLRRFALRAAVAMGTVVILSGVIPTAVRSFSHGREMAALPQAEVGAPNVLLLILDTVRAASLGIHGYSGGTTPKLEEYATQGTVFDMAVSTTSWTLPAHASMFTGRMPWETSAGWSSPLEDSWPTLAEELARQGYATAGFAANYYYAGRPSGLARGFVHYEDAPVTAGMIAMNSWWLHRLTMRIREKLQIKRFLTHKDAGQVVGAFLEWLSEHEEEERPFMAFLNFMDAHAPYFAPDSILRMYTGEGTGNGATYDSEHLRDMNARYHAGIAYIDQEIGRLLDYLNTRGTLDRTIVIVTSDHGEQLGERDSRLTSHGNSLYHSSTHVPLMIRFPPAVPAGIRVSEAVSTRRIPATVLDLLGMGGSAPFPGTTLANEWSGDQHQNDEMGELPVSTLLPSLFKQAFHPVSRGPMVSVTSSRWHYIRNGDGVEELYDVLADPWERNDLSADGTVSDVMDRLRSRAPAPVSQ